MDERPAVGNSSLRSVFLSDFHLGSRYAQAESLLEYLRSIQPDSLYLVGDIIDGWRLKRRWHWRPVFSQILARLFELGQSGTRIRLTPGNHDAFLREFVRDFGFVEIAHDFVHRTADGRRFMVVHGDRFDDVEARAPWLSRIGAGAYESLLWIDASLNCVRTALGLERQAYGSAIKRRFKQAVTFVSQFERRLLQAAREAGCDGIICGHIHTPLVSHDSGLTYFNTGDWVEHRSALVEHGDGKLELVHFPCQVSRAKQSNQPQATNAHALPERLPLNERGAMFQPTAGVS